MVKALHVKDTKTAAQHQDIKNADGSTSTGPVGRRGFIVSETKDAKDKSDREKFGEPSKIVVLTNLVGRSEVDDDLPNEIGSRLLHMMWSIAHLTCCV